MKRELFENVKVFPGGTGAAINRTGFLSAILAISATKEDTFKIKVDHADTEDGEFTELDDPFAGVTGALDDIKIEAGSTVNICIDLTGCKNYVKFSVEGSTPEAAAGSTEGSTSGTTVSIAVVLGDPATAPV